MKNEITESIYAGFNPLEEDSRGWNSRGVIFEQLIQKVSPSVIVEVGSWKGASAITMCKALQKLNLDCKIYCVDTWLGAEEFWTHLSHTEERDLMLSHGYPQIYYQFLSNIVHSGFQRYVLPLPLPSNIAINVLSYKKVMAELIYVDGSHAYEDVKADITNYLKILRPKGIMFGDDYGAWPGVRKAVQETLEGKFTVVDNSYWVYES